MATLSDCHDADEPHVAIDAVNDSKTPDAKPPKTFEFCGERCTD
jgi:hypothetical protein